MEKTEQFTEPAGNRGRKRARIYKAACCPHCEKFFSQESACKRHINEGRCKSLPKNAETPQEPPKKVKKVETVDLSVTKPVVKPLPFTRNNAAHKELDRVKAYITNITNNYGNTIYFPPKDTANPSGPNISIPLPFPVPITDPTSVNAPASVPAPAPVPTPVLAQAIPSVPKVSGVVTELPIRELFGRNKKLLGRSRIVDERPLACSNPHFENALESAENARSHGLARVFPNNADEDHLVKKLVFTAGESLKELRDAWHKKWEHKGEYIIIKGVYDRDTKRKFDVPVPLDFQRRNLWKLFIYLTSQKVIPFNDQLCKMLWDYACETRTYTQQQKLDYLAYFMTQAIAPCQIRAMEQEYETQVRFLHINEVPMPLPNCIEMALRLYQIAVGQTALNSGQYRPIPLITAITRPIEESYPGQKRKKKPISLRPCVPAPLPMPRQRGVINEQFEGISKELDDLLLARRTRHQTNPGPLFSTNLKGEKDQDIAKEQVKLMKRDDAEARLYRLIDNYEVQQRGNMYSTHILKQIESEKWAKRETEMIEQWGREDEEAQALKERLKKDLEEEEAMKKELDIFVLDSAGFHSS